MTETSVFSIDTSVSIGLLDRMAEFLRAVTPQDLKDLSTGNAWIAIGRAGDQQGRKPKPRKTAPSPRPAAPPLPDTDEIVMALKAANTQERCSAYLESLNLGKTGLQVVLNALGQRVLTKDNMSTLKSKIVRASVGVELQSEALQGL